MNIENIKNNCINLIMNDLNNCNSIPYYIKLPIPNSKLLDIDNFILDIKNILSEKLPDLYCDINIINRPELSTDFSILMIKIKKTI